MADYSELDTLVGALKRAAIDAWFHHEYGAVPQATQYEFAFGLGTVVSVSRPSADGTGGGVFKVVSTTASTSQLPGQKQPDFTTEFQQAMDNIRGRVENALAKWRDLPDPAVIDGEIDPVRQVTGSLSMGSTEDDGHFLGPGKVGGYLNVVQSDLNEMSGDTIEVFKALFLVQLGSVIGAYGLLARLAGIAIAAERTLWYHARQDVADIVESVTKSLDAYASSGATLSWKVALELADWTTEAISLFGMGGGEAVGGAVKLGLEVLEGFLDKASDAGSDSSGDYETLLTGMEKRLNDLNAGLTAAETAIQSNLASNYQDVMKQRSTFDLTLPAVSSSGMVLIHEPLVDGLVRVVMPKIADILDEASKVMSGATISVSRSSDVGIGSTGPAMAWYEMTMLVYELCADLSWKVKMGAKDLALAVEDMHQHDAASASRLRSVSNQISIGSGYDPYLPHYQGPRP